MERLKPKLLKSFLVILQ